MSNIFENTEKKFLNIVHLIFMLLAMLAFLAAIGISIWSIMLMNQSVPSEITTPKPTYSDFKVQRTTKQTEIQPQQKSSSEEDEYGKYKKLYIDSIEASLFKFSQVADNVRTTENTPKRIFLRAMQIKQYIDLNIFFGGLLEQCKELEKDAENIGKMNKNDANYVTWPEFLNFYFSKTINDIKNQKNQKSILQQRIEADYVKGKSVLTIAGVSFLMALFFVFFMLLSSIEKNLRKNDNNKYLEQQNGILSTDNPT